MTSMELSHQPHSWFCLTCWQVTRILPHPSLPIVEEWSDWTCWGVLLPPSFRMTLQGSSSSSSIGSPFPLVYLALSVFLLAAPGHPGCQEAGLCCSGRNVSCVSKGWKPDHSYGTCYCDQACVSTLDCCHDYETACPGKPVRAIKSTLIVSMICYSSTKKKRKRKLTSIELKDDACNCNNLTASFCVCSVHS